MGVFWKAASMGSWVHALPNKHNEFRVGYQGDPERPRWQATAPDGPNGEEVPWTMYDELGAAGFNAVRFWVSWYQLAQHIIQPRSPGNPDWPEYEYALGRPPQTFMEQAQFMDKARPYQPWWRPGLTQSLIQCLDDNIKLANDRGLFVILAVEQQAPTWSWTSTPHDSLQNEPGTNKLPFFHFPEDLGADSPYGWFIQYLIARYTGEYRPEGGPGCGCLPARGNPMRARIDAIEPLNEPNFEWWPQFEGAGGSACKTWFAMSTCEWWCRFYSIYYAGGNAPKTLGPSGADRTHDKREDVGPPMHNVGYEAFTRETLDLMREWQPVAPVRWAHHNYNDIEDHRSNTDPNCRLSKVAELLESYGFLNASPQNQAGRRHIYLTEGSSRMGDWNDVPSRPDKEATQAENIRHNLEQMQLRWDALMWTLHVVNDDPGSLTMYGPREWRNGRDANGNPLLDQQGNPKPHGPGAKRPSWNIIRNGA